MLTYMTTIQRVVSLNLKAIAPFACTHPHCAACTYVEEAIPLLISKLSIPLLILKLSSYSKYILYRMALITHIV